MMPASGRDATSSSASSQPSITMASLFSSTTWLPGPASSMPRLAAWVKPAFSARYSIRSIGHFACNDFNRAIVCGPEPLSHRITSTRAGSIVAMTRATQSVSVSGISKLGITMLIRSARGRTGAGGAQSTVESSPS